MAVECPVGRPGGPSIERADCIRNLKTRAGGRINEAERLVFANVPRRSASGRNIRGDETNLIDRAPVRLRLGGAILIIASCAPILANFDFGQSQAAR